MALSATLDKDVFLARGVPLDRHVLNDNSGMKANSDGSLEIYLQADSPGPDRESNWLPTPRDEFFTILRVYWPEQDMLDGKWHEPPVRKVVQRKPEYLRIAKENSW